MSPIVRYPWIPAPGASVVSAYAQTPGFVWETICSQ